MCGSGRALEALTTGQVALAIHLNPLIGFWIALLGLAWLELWAVALYGPQHLGPLRRCQMKLAKHSTLQGLLFATVVSWTIYANLFQRTLLST